MILNGAFLIKQDQETVWNAIRDPALMATRPRQPGFAPGHRFPTGPDRVL
jgi:hypothetical protein